MKRLLTLFACIFLAMASLSAQDLTPLIKRYMLDNQQKLNLNKEVIADGWQVSDQYLTEHNQVTQVYLQQMVNGLKLNNAISAVAVQKGEVKVFNSAFVADANRLANVLPGSQQLSATQAIERAAANVEVSISNLRRETVKEGIAQESVFSASGDVKDPIKVSLVYQQAQEDIRLAWNVEFPSKSDWWHIRVDALTGAILDKGNYTVYCNFHSDAYHHAGSAQAPVPEDQSVEQAPIIGQGYRVFPFPGESPIHTSHQLISNPSDAVASPYGWHDTNGQPGAEYTITRGNNVLASEDRDDNNQPGHSPDGGNDLIFDFPYNPVQTPETWEDAAITNLFYANNIMHDITYHRGFDEGAGNFQQNNYGNGGAANDAVQADAQDGSGTDNANFSTPPDGSSGRMQMYIWTTTAISSPGDSIRVLSPANIAGSYYAPTAQFGPAITAPITGEVVLIEDALPPTSNGCDPLVNAAALAGKIVVVDRGTCTHVLKVQVAQEAGAIGVIVVHNLTSPPFAMPGSSSTINIPSVMISQADGQLLKDQLLLGPVTLSLLPPAPANSDRDSDLDNGIIAHEYGHGISTRLTGGPSNSGCLNNAEQMGEGWSDFFALLTTIRPNDTRFTKRPMGTYAVGQTTSGNGIRNQLYSTDMSVNTYTYGDMAATGGETHNIGELWTTMLWDLTWDLIDVYGYNPDLTANTGGNNIAHQLVMDGLKLQKCNPGFVDGRDAILEADEIDYVGANKCLIWKAFARRGLGYSAKQGSSDSYTDGTQAFDIPPTCQIAVSAPIANFTVNRTNSCLELATFQFGDQSQNIAQEWLWDFGDGVTSTEPNPTHTYLAEGSYDVTLIVKNNIATDTLIRTAYITVGTLPVPIITGQTICAGHSANLSIAPAVAGNTAEWLDANGDVVYVGPSFTTPLLTANTTYSVRESEPAPSGKVGPTTFGPGGNHNNTFIGKVLFTAQSAFTIKSVLVRAQGNGVRVVRLFDDAGNEISNVSVPVPNGESRITLNLKVPGPGNYSLGAGPNTNLYRNNDGASYPYTIANLVSITGTNSTGGQGFYYYFYDWDVQKDACRSSTTDVTVTVTPGPVAAFSSTRNGLSVAFNDQSTGNPSNWAWNFGDGNTSNVPSPTHTYATTGVYTVELTVTNGSTCSTVFTQTIDFTSGTNNPNPDQFFVGLSPNPATGTTTLLLSGELGGHLVQVGIYGADGRLIKTIPHDTAKSAALQLDLQDLAPGLYLVKVEAAVGTVVKKLLVH